jgi:hypothetical protein
MSCSFVIILVYLLRFLIGICLLYLWRFGDIYILFVFLFGISLVLFLGFFVGRVK